MRKYRDKEGFKDEVSEEERKEEAKRELRLIRQFRAAVSAMDTLGRLNLFHIVNPAARSTAKDSRSTKAAALDIATTVPPKKRRAVGKWHIMFFPFHKCFTERKICVWSIQFQFCGGMLFW